MPATTPAAVPVRKPARRPARLIHSEAGNIARSVPSPAAAIGSVASSAEGASICPARPPTAIIMIETV